MSFFLHDPRQTGAVEYALEDAFTFGCDMCGACCNALERTVVLSGPDVARVAAYLGISREAFLARYTVTLADPADGIPYVVLRPAAAHGGCVLQRAEKCLVHPAKPCACALYPLSRGFVLEKPGKGGRRHSVKYTADEEAFLCGNARRTFTVEEWLRESNVPAHDTDDMNWAAFLASLLEEQSQHPKGLDEAALFHCLYVSDRWRTAGA